MKALRLLNERVSDPVASRKQPTIDAQIVHLRRFLASDWCLVLAVLTISLACFALAERVPVGDGFGWDGVLYGNWARDFHEEVFVKQVNTYYIQRVLPSAVIHYSLRILRVPLTDSNILAAFGVYACVLLTLMAACWRRIAQELRIGLAGKWLGFAAFFLNYIALKYVFYCPASTDINAYALGLAMLLCYLRRQTFWLATLTLIGAFCWPLCVHAGAIMLIFPRPAQQSPVQPPTPVPLQFGAALLLTGVAAGGILLMLHQPLTLETVFVQPEFVMPYRPALNLSVAICLIYVFLGSFFLFSAGFLFSPRLLFSPRRLTTALLVVLGMLAVKYVQRQVARHEPVDEFAILLSQTASTSVVRPGVFLVTHIALYGPVFMLTALLWKTVCAEMQHGGPALTFCALIALVPSLNSQSRFFLNLFPLLVPFVVKAAERLQPGRWQLGCFAILSLLMSKVWFTINTGPFHGRLHEFPDQGLFMSHGPWISPTMYAVQGCAYAFVGLILYWSWFHARTGVESLTPQLTQSSEAPTTRAVA